MVALKVSGDAERYSLGVARGTTATFGTSMKLLDESAEVRIGLAGIFWVGVVYKLVAVVVHLHSAAGANNLVSLGHSVTLVSVDQSRDICSRPWRSVLAIQMSSFKNLSIRRM